MTPAEALKLQDNGLYLVHWTESLQPTLCRFRRGGGSPYLNYLESTQCWRCWDKVARVEPMAIVPAKDVEPEPETEPEPPKVWDYIAEKVGRDRTVCKIVLVGMMYGLEVMPQIVKYGVRHDEVVEMRMAFDDYVHEHKEKKDG